jgi:hypothetical protein
MQQLVFQIIIFSSVLASFTEVEKHYHLITYSDQTILSGIWQQA